MPETAETPSMAHPTGLRVLRVLNERELVIAGPAVPELDEGDIVRVLGDPDPIEDPDSGEVLGTVRSTKVLLRVYNIEPKFALARTFRSEQVQVPQGIGAGLFAPPKFETRTELLSTNESHSQAIKVGDIVEVWEGASTDAPNVTAWSD